MNKIFLTATLIASLMLTGCGDEPKQSQNATPKNSIDLSNAKDGTYTAESSRDSKLGLGKITLDIQNHKITNAEFVGVDLFGNVKGEDYGTLTGDKNSADYRKAQIAVKANADYAKQLVETQSLDKIDAVSGATISYNQFVEAAKIAVDEASK